MKKVLAILLALTMALSLCSTAWATDGVVETEGEANAPVAQENGIVVAEGEANAPVVQEGATPVVVAKIGDTGYDTLEKAVRAVPDGGTITLTQNSAGPGIATFRNPTGDQISAKSFTIDFKGCTYTIGFPAVGSSGTESQAFHLEKTNAGTPNVTFKDGTINVDSTFTGAMVIQNYCNLTLDNMVIDSTAMARDGYTLSNNNGNTTINHTKINAKLTDVAFDVYGGMGSYGDVTVTVENGSVINGKVEVTRDNTTNTARNKLVVTDGTFRGEVTVKGNDNTSASITGGIFVNDVSAFSGDNAVLKFTTKDSTKSSYIVGTNNITQAASTANAGDTLEVAKGDVTLTGVASGVTVAVASGASATVNNTVVSTGSYTVPASGEASKNAAKIGTTEYRTLAEAVAAAKAGDTIELLNNVTLDSALVIKKDCKLDLGGKTLSRTGGYVLDIYSNVTITNGTVNITGASSQKNNTCAIWVNDNAKLTVDSTAKITTTNDNNIGNFAIGLDQSCNGAELIFNGEINAANGITVNGNIKAPKTNTLTINGKITATEHALYLAGNAATTVNSSAQLTGNTGIEIRAGKLNVAGGSVTSKGTYTAAPNGKGGTTEGAAIAVAQHTTKQAIEVNITGGVISADATGKAIAVSDPQGNNLDNVKVNVKGGTVNGTVLIEKNIAAKKPASVTGGIFTDNVTSLVPATTPIAKVTIGGKTTFVVGAENIQNVAKTAKSGDVIEITQGNVTLTGIAGGVTVKTPGTAAATVNGTAVTAKAYPNGYTVPTYTGGGTGGGFPSSGTKKDDTKKDIKSATTFDAGIALYVGMSILSLTGTAAVIGKKKEF